MRALFIPFPVISNIWRDGKFLSVWDYVEKLADHHHYHCYVLLQSKFRKDFEQRYPTGRPNVTIVWDDTFAKYPNRDQHRMVDSRLLVEQFSRRYGFYQIDWVWVTEPEIAPQVRSLLSDHSKRDQTVKAIPVLVADTGTVTPSVWWNSSIPLMDLPSVFNRALGFVSGYPIFFSERERDRGKVEYEQWLSPFAVKEIAKRTLILPPMLATDTLDAIPQDKRGTITLLYGGRISTDKNIKLVRQILSAAYTESGDRLDVRISSPTESVRNQECADFVREFKSKTSLGVTRDQFWSIAATSHIGLCASFFENVGMGFLEQLYLGCAVLIPKRTAEITWMDGVYPEWYPWRYGSVEEAVMLIRKLAATYHTDAVQPMLAQCRAWLHETFGEAVVLNRLSHFLSTVVRRLEPPNEELFYTPPQRQLDWLARAIMFCRGKHVSLHTLTRLIPRYTKFYSENRITRGNDRLIFSDYDISCLIAQWGLHDDTSVPVTTYTIPEDWSPPFDLKEKKARAAKEK